MLGDGDAFAGLDDFGDVALGCVVGDAAHGDAVAFGEGDVEDFCGGLGVLEEHLVEVAEAVEEQDVIGQGAAHCLVLRHHRGEFLFFGHAAGRGFSEWAGEVSNLELSKITGVIRDW